MVHCLLKLEVVVGAEFEARKRRTDLALDAHLEPYDIAPLIPIIEGAGGIVTTWERGPAGKGGNVLAASSHELHEEALAVISG